MRISDPCAMPSVSPLPHEPDLTVSIYLTDRSPYPFKYVACESAARRFADHWRRYGRCGAIEFTAPDSRYARLPCERLWIVP